VVRASLLAVAASVALVAAGVALADKEKIARTAAGNAQARAEVVHRADLGSGWSGGFRRPVLNVAEPCSYHPKQSDLVVVGAAQSTWNSPAYEIDSEAQVLRTAAMVRRDWRRTAIAPQVLPCLRQSFKKLLGSHGKIVSVRRVAFPHLAPMTVAWRLRAKIKSPSGGTVPFESDFVALGARRSELSLNLSAVHASQAALHAEALGLARVLAHRLRS
jgi:hypothetical protein